MDKRSFNAILSILGTVVIVLSIYLEITEKAGLNLLISLLLIGCFLVMLSIRKQNEDSGSNL